MTKQKEPSSTFARVKDEHGLPQRSLHSLLSRAMVYAL